MRKGERGGRQKREANRKEEEGGGLPLRPSARPSLCRSVFCFHTHTRRHEKKGEEVGREVDGRERERGVSAVAPSSSPPTPPIAVSSAMSERKKEVGEEVERRKGERKDGEEEERYRRRSDERYVTEEEEGNGAGKSTPEPFPNIHLTLTKLGGRWKMAMYSVRSLHRISSLGER